MTHYPPPPWRLAGPFVATVRFIRRSEARAYVPADARIPPVVVSALAVARYDEGDPLQYSEMIHAVGPVYRGGFGFWISSIFVDDERSLAGGHEIWGLPKEMATFEWTSDTVTVRQDERVLTTLRFSSPSIAAPLPMWIRSLGTRGAFSAFGSARAGVGRVNGRPGLVGNVDVRCFAP